MVVTGSFVDLLRQRIADAQGIVRRTNKASVLVLQQFPVLEDPTPLLPPVRESIANVLTFVELGRAADAREVLGVADGTFDIIALDCDQKLPESAEIVGAVQKAVEPKRLLRYSDNQAWFDSALDMVQRLQEGVTEQAGVVCGSGFLADQLRYVLPRLGADLVPVSDRWQPGRINFVLGCAQKQVCVDRDLVETVAPSTAIYDLGIGTLSLAAAERAREKGVRLYRLDNRAGISTAIIRLLETDYMVRRLMGHIQVRGIDIVAGGLLAPAGAVVVDDIKSPSLVFGVSDGAGRFRPAPLSTEDQARIEFVKSLIAQVG